MPSDHQYSIWYLLLSQMVHVDSGMEFTEEFLEYLNEFSYFVSKMDGDLSYRQITAHIAQAIATFSLLDKPILRRIK